MWNEVNSRIKKSIQTIKSGMYGRITSVIKGSGVIFMETSEEDELRDINIVCPPGIYSLPTVNSYGQVIFNNSSKKASLVGIEGSPPIEVDIGEIVMFNSKAKTHIFLKNDGEIMIKGKATINLNKNGEISMSSTSGSSIELKDGKVYIKGEIVNV